MFSLFIHFSWFLPFFYFYIIFCNLPFSSFPVFLGGARLIFLCVSAFALCDQHEFEVIADFSKSRHTR